MRQDNSEKEAYNLVLFHETPKAYLVGREPKDRETDNAMWLPKSQVSTGLFSKKDGVEWAEFMIPQWLAQEKGLDASLDGVVE